MENSREHSDLAQYDNENQVLILIQKLASAFFGNSAIIILTALHYTFLPVVLIYSFWEHALKQTWTITKQISHEIFELMKIVPLTFEIWFWSTLILLQFVLFFKNKEEANEDVEKKVYGKSKCEILRKLNVLPLTTQNAAAFYSFMIRIPIFGKGRLPFPNFLFEDTFTKIQFRNGVISITVPSPKDLSQPAAAEASAPAQASVQSSSLQGPPLVVTEPQFEAAPESRKSSAGSNEKPNLADSSSTQGSSDSESDVKTSR